MIMNLNYLVNAFSSDLRDNHLTVIGTWFDYTVVMQSGNISPDASLIEDVSRNVTRIIDFINYTYTETTRYINYETNITYPITDVSRFSKCCELMETIINFFNNLFRRV